MSDKKADKCILSPPGGPAGPFWGVVKQSGLVVALQIIERVDAEILRLVLDLIAGDFDENRTIGKELFNILEREGTNTNHRKWPTGANDFIVRCVAEAICNVASKKT